MAVSVATVIGWISLYLFERSWAKTIGFAGTLLIYSGGLCYILDRLWFEKFRNLYVGSLNPDAEPVDETASTPLQFQPDSK
jgi:lipoprotein signal peptidase